MKKIVLIRHGETDWNNMKKYQGASDIPLNSAGRAQARRTSVRLEGWPLDRIVSSPKERALETSEIIRDRISPGAELHIHSGLSEISYGKWEGMTVSAIKAEYGDLYSAWKEDPTSYTPPGGESFDDALNRVSSAMEDILRPGRDDEDIAVICHGGTIRLLLVSLLDISPSLVWRMKIQNCSLNGVQVLKGKNILAFLNDHLHILVNESVLPLLPVLF
jgi:alpha-ribazole phosphatase/probable phosphoglycerate mutase